MNRFLPLVCAVLCSLLMWVFGRMSVDELDMKIGRSYSFTKESGISSWNCNTGMFRFDCSGLLTTPQSSVPVWFTCDRDNCQFEHQ